MIKTIIMLGRGGPGEPQSETADRQPALIRLQALGIIHPLVLLPIHS